MWVVWCLLLLVGLCLVLSMVEDVPAPLRTRRAPSFRRPRRQSPSGPVGATAEAVSNQAIGKV